VPVCSLAVRDEAVRAVLSSEAAVKTRAKILSSVAVAESDIDEVVNEMQLSHDSEETKSEVCAVSEAVLD